MHTSGWKLVYANNRVKQINKLQNIVKWYYYLELDSLEQDKEGGASVVFHVVVKAKRLGER